MRQVQLKEPDRVLRSYPFQLSGGMRQRVLIAMALMHRPKLLIADEPGTALDVTTQDEILRLLNHLVSEERLTLLMVTHNLAVVRQTSDYVYVMQAGTIVEHGPVREIFDAPRSAYTQRLLEAIPPLYGPKVQHRQAHSTTPVITAIEVAKLYAAPRRLLEPARPPVTAVRNASLSICKGDVFGIAGESGSGKIHHRPLDRGAGAAELGHDRDRRDDRSRTGAGTRRSGAASRSSTRTRPRR